MSKPSLSPSAAHFESIARSRPKDYYLDLCAELPVSGARLLDAGCASGRLTMLLAQRAEFTVGLDLSRELIELARTQRQTLGANRVNWVVGDMEHLPFESDSFDAVASTNAVRLTNVPITLQELARIVKPGGRMAIQDILRKRHPFRPALISSIAWTLSGAPRYLRFYGPIMLLRILAYRFSPAQLARAAAVGRLSLDVMEELYETAAPGSKVRPKRWGYLASWQKPTGTRSNT